VPDPDLDRETVDHIAITRLQAAYADLVNRRAWDELDRLFLPGAPITIDTVTRPVLELSGPAEFAAFVGPAVERFEFFEFVVLTSHVTIDGDGASARLWMCEQRQGAANGQFSTAYGLYRDDYRRTDGGWRFARRRYRSLARTGRNEAFGLPDDL
jgi:hypothetical protein